MALVQPQKTNTKTTKIEFESRATGDIMIFDGDPNRTILQPGNDRLSESEIHSNNNIFKIASVDGSDADRGTTVLYHTLNVPYDFFDLSALFKKGDVIMKVSSLLPDAKYKSIEVTGRGTLNLSTNDEATVEIIGTFRNKVR